MTRTPRLFALLAASLLALPLSAQAQKNARACMIESTLEVMGAPSTLADCLQGTDGVRRSVIKDRCEGIAWHAAAGLGRDKESTLTWLAQCPRKEADAVCKGAFDGDFDIYYYDRNDGQLDALAEQCETEGGRWQEFD